MMRIVPCIKFGEIIMNENQKFLMLCINCHKDYTTLYTFQKHLHTCEGAAKFVEKNASISFVNNENLYDSKMIRCEKNTLKEFRIYRPSTAQVTQNNNNNEVDKTDTDGISTLDLDAELSDPRWYTASEKAGSVKLATTDRTSAVTIKQPPLKENGKTNKDVDTKTTPAHVSPINEAIPEVSRLTCNLSKPKQEPKQHNKVQPPPSFLPRKVIIKSTNSKCLDAKAKPELKVSKSNTNTKRSSNGNEDCLIDEHKQNEANPSVLRHPQTIVTASQTKKVLNGSVICPTNVDSELEFVKINPRVTRSSVKNDSASSISVIKDNPNSKIRQKQSSEAPQKTLLTKKESSPTITENNKRLSNESISTISDASQTKKRKLSEESSIVDVPFLKGITLSKATKPGTVTAAKVDSPPSNDVKDDFKPANVPSMPASVQTSVIKCDSRLQQGTVPVKTKEISNNQPAQTELILNKLQNLGVEVKRKPVSTTQPFSVATNSNAMKIIQKLQLNGVKVITMKQPRR